MFYHHRNAGKPGGNSAKKRFLPGIERLESRDTPAAPFISQVSRFSPTEQQTNSTAVLFRVAFNEDMNTSTINATNTFMAVVTSGSAVSFASIQNVSIVNLTTFDVEVANLPDTGELSLTLNPNNQAKDVQGEQATQGSNIPDPNQTFTLLAKPSPLVVTGSSIITPNPADPSSPTVQYQITFGKNLNPNSISTADFQLIKNNAADTLDGTVISAAVNALNPTAIEVTVGHLVGKGKFHIEIPPNSSIIDTEGQPFLGTFSTQDYFVDRLPPRGIPITFSLSTFGSLPIVEVRYSNSVIKNIQPFDPAFKGGVKAATGDYNGDGYMDIIATAADGGQGHIVVYDGISLNVISSFYAYPGYKGAVNIASGDLSGTGRDDIVVGVAGPGPSHVTAFRFNQASYPNQNIPVTNFYAYPGYLGGITVTAGDMTGDGKADISTGTMGGTTPHVVIFDLNPAIPQNMPVAWRSFYAFDPQYFGIVNLASGDFNGDLVDELITSSGPGAASTIIVFQINNNPTPEVYRSFLPFGGKDLGGVTVAVGDWEVIVNKKNLLYKNCVIAGAQSGPKPLVNVFNIEDPVVPKLIDELFAFGGSLPGGVSVG